MALVLENEVLAEQVEVDRKKLATGLRFLLDRNNVPPGVQAKFAQAGITDVDILPKLEDKAEDMRQTINKDLGINPKASLANKVLVAKLLGNWEIAVPRGIKRKEEEAELAAQDLPRKLAKSSHIELCRAYAISRLRKVSFCRKSCLTACASRAMGACRMSLA